MVDSFSWETGIRKIFLGKVSPLARWYIQKFRCEVWNSKLRYFVFSSGFLKQIECVFDGPQQDCVKKALDLIVLLHLEFQALFRAKTLPGYLKKYVQQHGRSLQLAEHVI